MAGGDSRLLEAHWQVQSATRPAASHARRRLSRFQSFVGRFCYLCFCAVVFVVIRRRRRGGQRARDRRVGGGHRPNIVYTHKYIRKNVTHVEEVAEDDGVHEPDGAQRDDARQGHALRGELFFRWWMGVE